MFINSVHSVKKRKKKYKKSKTKKGNLTILGYYGVPSFRKYFGPKKCYLHRSTREKNWYNTNTSFGVGVGQTFHRGCSPKSTWRTARTARCLALPHFLKNPSACRRRHLTQTCPAKFAKKKKKAGPTPKKHRHACNTDVSCVCFHTCFSLENSVLNVRATRDSNAASACAPATRCRSFIER